MFLALAEEMMMIMHCNELENLGYMHRTWRKDDDNGII